MTKRKCNCTDRWIDPKCAPTTIGGPVQCENFGKVSRRDPPKPRHPPPTPEGK